MTIRHSRGTYDVRFVQATQLPADLDANHFVITDELVAQLYGGQFTSPLKAVPQGEQSKSMTQAESLLEWLAGSGANRSSTIVALGGGVVGDLAGFVASTYMRGIKLLQIPTTLLAQVDSSVGGKVGIDLNAGKNLAGAFWPPIEVRVCVGVLQTLSARHFLNGMSEVWKYGLILERGLFEDLKRRPLAPDDPRLETVVKRCIELKASVVAEDEFETTGKRAILNFGHTIGHAIEQVTGYGPILHGEAIAVGMELEARLGERLGITAAGTADQVAQALIQNMPADRTWVGKTDQMMAAIRRDKKADGYRLAFSLLSEIGACRLVKDVPEEDVRAVLTP